MSDDKPIERTRRPVVINTASAGGTILENCFFLPIAEIKGQVFYNFYNGDGKTLATGVSDGVTFPFLLDGIAWTISHLEIYHPPEIKDCERIEAKGHWTNTVTELAEAGTFAAESGGGVIPEAYSASA
ncbi:MAG TPA: hypothetical protein VN844_25985 [Pyrinomonadaceae bacterium]|nr:hypothetical protein [Pyrinomonadaceae bacterium]